MSTRSPTRSSPTSSRRTRTSPRPRRAGDRGRVGTRTRPERRDAHDQRARRRGPQGRDGHCRCARRRRVRAALLLPPAHVAGRDVSPVHGRSRGAAWPDDGRVVHDSGRRRPGGPHRHRSGQACPGGHARTAPRQPPARLPGLRQGRRVSAPGPGVQPRPGRESVRRVQASLREADPDLRSRVPRPRALHPVRPLHAVRRRSGRRQAHPLHQPWQRHPGDDVPRRAVRVVLLGQHRADLPGRCAHREAVPVQGPTVGPRTSRSRPAPPARSAVAPSCNRAATSCCATRASTPTR